MLDIKISLIFLLIGVKAIEAENSGPFGSGPFTFVVSPYIPMIECNLSDTNLTNMDGADIMLLRDIIKELKWEEANYSVICLDKQPVFDFLKANNNSLAIAGISISKSRSDLGYQFSIPTYANGFSLLKRDKLLNLVYVKVMTIIFTVLLLLTVLITSASLYFVNEVKESFIEFTFQQLANLLVMAGNITIHLPGRLIIFAFWAFALLLIETYISVIAEVMIDQAEEFTIPDEMNNRNILSQSTAVDILYGFEANTKEIKGIGDNFNVYDALMDNPGYEAIAADDVLVYIGDLIHCDVHRELSNFFLAEFALMFGPDVPYETIAIFNTHLTHLVPKVSTLERLDDYVERKYKSEECDYKYKQSKIGINEMKELWIIFLCFMIVSIIVYILGIMCTKKKIEIPELEKAEEASEMDLRSIDKYSVEEGMTGQAGGTRTLRPEASSLSLNENSMYIQYKSGEERLIENLHNSSPRIAWESEEGERKSKRRGSAMRKIGTRMANFRDVKEINLSISGKVNKKISKRLNYLGGRLQYEVEDLWNLVLNGNANAYILAENDNYRGVATEVAPQPNSSYRAFLEHEEQMGNPDGVAATEPRIKKNKGPGKDDLVVKPILEVQNDAEFSARLAHQDHLPHMIPDKDIP